MVIIEESRSESSHDEDDEEGPAASWAFTILGMSAFRPAGGGSSELGSSLSPSEDADAVIFGVEIVLLDCLSTSGLS